MGADRPAGGSLMAIRIRTDGSMVCAAKHPELPGDRYVDDALHQRLSADFGVLVSEPHERHQHDGLWWWFDQVPTDREPDPYYEGVRDVLA